MTLSREDLADRFLETSSGALSIAAESVLAGAKAGETAGERAAIMVAGCATITELVLFRLAEAGMPAAELAILRKAIAGAIAEGGEASQKGPLQ
ncbi:hypothetical protein E3C22_18020 [Jiella endophytica]|uniref:Uncharacterized protein n=1 Tax=Jiella endophytica TaxID=2558362 RepID=A0A4Y8RGU3_9HYPH|nr:hypothetical protein [Jiella endophytica]TFF20787.1 hypothetical protein E3C22_18020 [Jiella endophytica]